MSESAGQMRRYLVTYEAVGIVNARDTEAAAEELLAHGPDDVYDVLRVLGVEEYTPDGD